MRPPRPPPLSLPHPLSLSLSQHRSEDGLGLVSVADVTNSTCGANEAASLHHGGECVACGAGAVVYSGAGDPKPLACACPATEVPLRVGSAACGGPRVPLLGADPAATSADAAASLCAHYTARHALLLGGGASASAVADADPGDFEAAAHALVDREAMRRANATLVGSLMTDGRHTVSPTRRGGLGPDCFNCDGGTFASFAGGGRHAVRDIHFRAVQTLRLIGLALHNAGESSRACARARGGARSASHLSPFHSFPFLRWHFILTFATPWCQKIYVGFTRLPV